MLIFPCLRAATWGRNERLQFAGMLHRFFLLSPGFESPDTDATMAAEDFSRELVSSHESRSAFGNQAVGLSAWSHTHKHAHTLYPGLVQIPDL